eukprot:scaffold312471_cov31-Tisochrysis_lutea.AAC.1
MQDDDDAVITAAGMPLPSVRWRCNASTLEASMGSGCAREPAAPEVPPCCGLVTSNLSCGAHALGTATEVRPCCGLVAGTLSCGTHALGTATEVPPCCGTHALGAPTVASCWQGLMLGPVAGELSCSLCALAAATGGSPCSGPQC